MMHRCLVLLLSLAALAVGATSTAAQGTPAPLGGEGPRFLAATTAGLVPLNVGRTPVLNQRVSLSLNGSIEAALAELTRQTGAEFMYGSEAVSPTRSVRVRLQNVPMAAALAEVLRGYDVDVVVPERGGTIIVRPRERSSSPAAPVVRGDTGVVVGAVQVAGSQEGLPGVQVSIDERRRVLTNERGVFIFRGVPPGEHTIRASLIGYRADSATVVVQADSVSSLLFALEYAPIHLTDVVVTATGDRRGTGRSGTPPPARRQQPQPEQRPDHHRGRRARVLGPVGRARGESGGGE